MVAHPCPIWPLSRFPWELRYECNQGDSLATVRDFPTDLVNLRAKELPIRYMTLWEPGLVTRLFPVEYSVLWGQWKLNKFPCEVLELLKTKNHVCASSPEPRLLRLQCSLYCSFTFSNKEKHKISQKYLIFYYLKLIIELLNQLI